MCFPIDFPTREGWFMDLAPVEVKKSCTAVAVRLLTNLSQSAILNHMPKVLNYRAIKKTLNQIIDQLKAYQPEKIILYGSLARGEPAKDIDLLVIKKTKKSYFSRLQEINQRYLNRWQLDVPLDLTVYTPDEFDRAKREKRVFVDQVEKYGRILYQKTL